MTNTIRELLDNVVRTGRLPDHVAVRNSITTYSSVAERREVERKIRIAAKKIVGALDSGLADQAAEHAADVAEALAAHTAAGASTDELPERGWSRKHEHSAVRRPNSHGERQLADSLGAATRGGLSASEVDRLAAQVPEAERAAFRERLVQASDDVHRTYRKGDQAAARSLAKQYAAELGDALDEPEPVDLADGIDDPRQLAGLIPRS